MFMLISAALLAVGAIQAPPFPTATVTLAAPIFVAPGAKVPLRVAAKGTFLHVLKEDADWVEVEFQDPQYGRRVGWMEARFLSISRPALQPMDLSVAKASAAARPSAEPGAIQEKPDSPISGRVSAGARHSQTRKGFWFNVGLGAGSLGCDNCTGRANGLSGGLSLGGRINDKWLVGVGTTGWTKSAGGETLTMGTLDARFRFYPVRTSGFFLTGGVGAGSISFAGESEFGAGAVVGVGWDIRIARNISLTPFYNGFAMRSSLADANVSQLGIGITVH